MDEHTFRRQLVEVFTRIAVALEQRDRTQSVRVENQPIPCSRCGKMGYRNVCDSCAAAGN